MSRPIKVELKNDTPTKDKNHRADLLPESSSVSGYSAKK